MREWISLCEEWVHTVVFSNGEEHDILRNPERRDVFKMIAADRHHQVRALATPTDIYVFSAEMTHGDAQTALGWPLWDHARIFIDADGPYLNVCDDMANAGSDEDYDDPKDREHNRVQRAMVDDWCTNHPVLRRWFPSYTLGIR
jgi:hypothetical protein